MLEAALACAGITQASTTRARNIRRRPMLPRISDDVQVALSENDYTAGRPGVRLQPDRSRASAPVVIQREVAPPQRDQLLVRSRLDHLTVLEHDDQVGAADRAQPVRDHERRSVLEQ